jgi:octaheme c-type cytochrome (tetrathionate reductase family)
MKFIYFMLLTVLVSGFLIMSCVSTEDEEPVIMVEEVTNTETEEVETVEMNSTGPFSHSDTDILQGPFEKPQQVTAACISCHQEEASDFMQTVHWTWEGEAPGLEGHAGSEPVGKMSTINNFCIAVDSNWARCTQCHAGYGWKDNSYDFSKAESVDCLVCHDTTGTYKKNPKAAGMPFEDVDLAMVSQNVGDPSRANCGACHFFAGGGDNVKKGDLGTALTNPAPEVDVHMGKLGFSCQSCHTADNHQIKGSSLHVSVSSGSVTCSGCHSGSVHGNDLLNNHTETVSCQTCHVPAFSRAQATKMYWDWSTAGEKDADGKPFKTKDENGNLKYDSMKGDFIYEQNVRPEYAWWNGNFKRMLVGDAYKELPADLASPIGNIDDTASKIYPFKVMRGKQGADPVNSVLIVPHLFPSSAGENAYWKKWNVGKAFEEGMAAAGLEYSGTYDWVETYMYMAINHEVAPKAEALSCNDCHNGGIDFEALGYDGDPMMTGGRKL